MHEVLFNRLGGLSLPRKSVVRLTDRPDMTLDVYRGRKTTIQQQQLLFQFPSHKSICNCKYGSLVKAVIKKYSKHTARIIFRSGHTGIKYMSLNCECSPVPRLWIRSAEVRGERRKENGNTTTMRVVFLHFRRTNWYNYLSSLITRYVFRDFLYKSQ